MPLGKITFAPGPQPVSVAQWVSIPARFATYCVNCETVYHISAPDCPGCGSTHAHPLERWIPSTQRRAAS